MLLVTGITGHTGRYFIETLIENKYEGRIRCIVRPNSNTFFLDNSGLNIERKVGDMSNESFIATCLENVDTVMHIAGIQKSHILINALVKSEVSKVILVHTTGIYSKFKSASDEYKDIELRIKDIATQNSSLKLIILRPTMIYGDICDLNISKFIKMVDKLRVFPVINKGKSLIQPVNARDLGKAYYNVLNVPFDKLKSEYILSGEKPIEMIEVFNLISNNLSKKTWFVSVPLSVGVFLARLLKIISLGNIDYIEKVQRMGEDRSYSHEAAKLDFDYNPLPLSHGIAIEVEQYKSRG